MRMLRRMLGLASALALALGVMGPALAQANDAKWPTKPLRLIVPFAAGGGTDLVARALAERLGTALGHALGYDGILIEPHRVPADGRPWRWISEPDHLARWEFAKRLADELDAALDDRSVSLCPDVVSEC